MNKNIKLLFLVSTIILATGCNQDNKENLKEYYFTNASFENGNFNGWTANGNAFVNSTIDVISGDNKNFNIEGNFFYNGSLASNGATGTLISESFLLKGNGKIGFKIGAGKNTNACYIVLCDSDTDEELVYAANFDFDYENPSNRMHRTILDGSEYVGRSCYIKIVDNDNGIDDYNYLILDDFIINFQGKKEEVSMANDASIYIENNKTNVGNRYRGLFHFSTPIGWMNDPNGFSYYNNEVHLFYQHNPYSTGWSTMHWGHATTKDFIKWEDQPIALAPDKTYDKNGCFSGGAIEKNGELYLLYTSVDGEGKQQQALAKSNDGIKFTKLNNNPVIPTSNLPDYTSAYDFRDPALWYSEPYYYALIGAKPTNMSGGKILLYRSTNLQNDWEYVGTTLASTITGGGIYECPDYEVVDGKGVLISSPQFVKDDNIANYQNIHSATYQLGELDYNSGYFKNDNGEGQMTEFDKGFDFYAPTAMKHPDGRVILTAWMNMWSRTSFPSAADGWTGSMVLPRELSVKDNHLYQQPVREINNYKTGKVEFGKTTIKANETKDFKKISGDCFNLSVTYDLTTMDNKGSFGIELLKDDTNKTVITYDKETNLLSFDRSKSGWEISCPEDDGENFVRYAKIYPIDGKIKLDIYVDKSSVEIFINDGYYTMTSTVFPKNNATGISFFANDTNCIIENITKYKFKL